MLDSGLVIRFLDLFYGGVDLCHLHQPAGADWQTLYQEGQAVTARVIFVSHASKRISLSLRPHIVHGAGFDMASNQQSQSTLSLSTSVGDLASALSASALIAGSRVTARVLRIDNGLGLLMALSTDSSSSDESLAVAASSQYVETNASSKLTKKLSKKQATSSSSAVLFGYCHISHAADERVENLHQAFAVGSTHAARILFTHALDGLFNVSLRASVLAQARVMMLMCTCNLLLAPLTSSVSFFLFSRRIHVDLDRFSDCAGY